MTLTATATFQTTHYSEVSDETFLACLEALRRSAAAPGFQQNEKRGAERLDFYGNPVVACTLPAVDGTKPQAISFLVWGRDLSRGGVSFLSSPNLLPVQVGAGASKICCENVLRPNHEITIGLGRPDGEIMWLVAKIVRTRPVQDGLMESSVHFLRRRDAAKA